MVFVEYIAQVLAQFLIINFEQRGLPFIANAGFILVYCIAHYRVFERPLHKLFKKGLAI